MTEYKMSMDRQESAFSRKNKGNKEKIKEKRTQSKKQKQKKRKRLIIRNLSFKISEEELKNIFSKFGEILDVKIPVKEDGKKRGFAFIQYKDTKSQIKAMKEMNFKKIHDRPIAIDFAVDKTTYQSKKNDTKSSSPSKKNLNETASDDSEDSENDDMKSETQSQTDMESNNADANEEPEDSKVKAFFKEFDANDHADLEAEPNDESSDDEEDDDDDDDNDNDQGDSIREEEDNTDTRNKQSNKKRSEDVAEGKTVFIRNISYNIAQEDLKEVVQEYGDIDYCLFCMDPLSDQFKGSAFVKFKEKESADKLVEESSKGPGIILDNRALNCTYAVSREELSKQNISGKVQDRRNLRLLKCGMISYGSKEAEGVSKADMAKRAQLEMVKKQKLKNVNFFVSDKRLMIHNLPKNINDKDLYAMFKKAAGKGAVVTKARVMRDFKKTDAQGIPVSRGFGFVSFSQHEHALKALEELNNNPRIFTAKTRPIVEFSVENKVALLSQEKRKEKFRNRNKKKLEEEASKSEQQMSSPVNIKKMKGSSGLEHFSKNSRPKPRQFQKKQQNRNDSISSSRNQEITSKKKKNKRQNSTNETQETPPKKKQKKHSKGKNRKKTAINSQERSNLSALTNKYKEKLLNKYS